MDILKIIIWLCAFSVLIPEVGDNAAAPAAGPHVTVIEFESHQSR